MKRTILCVITILFLIILTSCERNGNVGDTSDYSSVNFETSTIDSTTGYNSVDGNTDYSSVKFESGIYYNSIIWDAADESILKQAVPDKETAIMLTEIIIKNRQKNGLFPGYTPQYVFFDEQKKVWIVSFWSYEKGNIGSCCTIAIQQDDAKILGMWVFQ